MYIIGEYYHSYNRGAHKAPIFHDASDYERFVSLLFVANNTQPLKSKWSQTKFWSMRREPIVTVVAYCLMPNHFHTCLSETSEGGIEKFMHTICTAYATYYNIKYKHSGTIFQGNYKCKHVDTDEYLQYLIEYIHLNPFGIENPDLLKSVKMEYRNEAIAYSEKYEYSSFRDYLGVKRPQNMIVEVYPRG